jgi:hypothetical protein
MEAGDASRSDAEWLKLVRCSTRGANQHRPLHRHKRGWSTACWFAVVAVEERSVRPWGGPLCTCMLVVLVGGLSIRPVEWVVNLCLVALGSDNLCLFFLFSIGRGNCGESVFWRGDESSALLDWPP